MGKVRVRVTVNAAGPGARVSRAAVASSARSGAWFTAVSSARLSVVRTLIGDERVPLTTRNRDPLMEAGMEPAVVGVATRVVVTVAAPREAVTQVAAGSATARQVAWVFSWHWAVIFSMSCASRVVVM